MNDDRSVVKRIDLSKDRFIANGKTYYMQPDQLTIERYQEYERLGLEMGFGVSYRDIYQTLSESYKALTTGNSIMESHRKAADLLVNQMSAIKEQGENRIPLHVMFCTLFCNTPGEDLTTWNKQLANDKIEDWKIEGLSAFDFFQLAASSLIGFNESLRLISEMAQKTPLKIPELTKSIEGFQSRKAN